VIDASVDFAYKELKISKTKKHEGFPLLNANQEPRRVVDEPGPAWFVPAGHGLAWPAKPGPASLRRVWLA